MWVFLGSECLLFGGLISTYLLYKHRSAGTARARRTSSTSRSRRVSSFVLLMSSLTMVLAVGGHPAGRPRGAAGSGCSPPRCSASVFIAGQVYEFTTFYREGLGYTTNLFGSAFYTLTGFHGVHVTVGIIMLLSLFVLSLRGHLGAERAETVEIVGLYWHFVDIVWIVIFTVVYLIP